MDIYREEIMEHYENPRNMGEIDEPDFEGKDSNASCGDMVQFQINVKDGEVKEVMWKGIGCAITTATSSKLSEYVKGKKVSALKEMNDQDYRDAIEIKVSPGRSKCVGLPISVIREMIEEVE